METAIGMRVEMIPVAVTAVMADAAVVVAAAAAATVVAMADAVAAVVVAAARHMQTALSLLMKRK